MRKNLWNELWTEKMKQPHSMTVRELHEEVEKMRRLLIDRGILDMMTPKWIIPTKEEQMKLCKSCGQTVLTSRPRKGEIVRILQDGPYYGQLGVVTAYRESVAMIVTTLMGGKYSGAEGLSWYPDKVEVVHGYIHVDRELTVITI